MSALSLEPRSPDRVGSIVLEVVSRDIDPHTPGTTSRLGHDWTRGSGGGVGGVGWAGHVDRTVVSCVKRRVCPSVLPLNFRNPVQNRLAFMYMVAVLVQDVFTMCRSSSKPLTRMPARRPCPAAPASVDIDIRLSIFWQGPLTR